MIMQEIHHPERMLRQGMTPVIIRDHRPPERGLETGDIAAQRVVDDTHHRGIRRAVQVVGHREFLCICQV
jgi:hypothetical protein